ncbi:hypothetical protein [Calothrix sp. PCC 7507]|uniref:hypothetical protein n=1 Tax=Calothrix sp. PCC 7507 TaxID=99598 RepID=UPI00029F1637|nr:hypothetical protein [Calothrix sp. PCC 7507]AFY36075.1 hypothetical protein Cal7507_5754 [Calothrix sp. PCC 7507]
MKKIISLLLFSAMSTTWLGVESLFLPKPASACILFLPCLNTSGTGASNQDSNNGGSSGFVAQIKAETPCNQTIKLQLDKSLDATFKFSSNLPGQHQIQFSQNNGNTWENSGGSVNSGAVKVNLLQLINVSKNWQWRVAQGKKISNVCNFSLESGTVVPAPVLISPSNQQSLVFQYGTDKLTFNLQPGIGSSAKYFDTEFQYYTNGYWKSANIGITTLKQPTSVLVGSLINTSMTWRWRARTQAGNLFQPLWSDWAEFKLIKSGNYSETPIAPFPPGSKNSGSQLRVIPNF